jgi:MFS family permease
MAFAGLVVVVVQPPAAAVLERRPRGRVLAGGLALVGAGFAATLAAGSVVGFGATAAIWSVGEIAVACVAGAMVADLAPAALRGRYMGVFSSVAPLAAVLAPALGTAMLERAGETALWVACGAIGAAAALAAVALSPGFAARPSPA